MGLDAGSATRDERRSSGIGDTAARIETDPVVAASRHRAVMRTVPAPPAMNIPSKDPEIDAAVDPLAPLVMLPA